MKFFSFFFFFSSFFCFHETIYANQIYSHYLVNGMSVTRSESDLSTFTNETEEIQTTTDDRGVFIDQNVEMNFLPYISHLTNRMLEQEIFLQSVHYNLKNLYNQYHHLGQSESWKGNFNFLSSTFSLYSNLLSSCSSSLRYQHLYFEKSLEFWSKKKEYDFQEFSNPVFQTAKGELDLMIEENVYLMLPISINIPDELTHALIIKRINERLYTHDKIDEIKQKLLPLRGKTWGFGLIQDHMLHQIIDHSLQAISQITLNKSLLDQVFNSYQSEANQFYQPELVTNVYEIVDQALKFFYDFDEPNTFFLEKELNHSFERLAHIIQNLT